MAAAGRRGQAAPAATAAARTRPFDGSGWRRLAARWRWHRSARAHGGRGRNEATERCPHSCARARSKVKFDDAIKALETDAAERYDAILAERQQSLTDLSSSLSQRLARWSHPDALLRLRWEGDPKAPVTVKQPYVAVAAGDASFEGSLARQGHGFQRSYLLALIQEVVATGADDAPKLILACEEPELYQHPPQARHMASCMSELARSGAQVLVCSHSPLFVSGNGFPDIRVVRRDANGPSSNIRAATHGDVATLLKSVGVSGPKNAEGARAKLHQLLQPAASEMFFTPILVLVEGLEDAAFLTSQMVLDGKEEEFRRLGCHIVPADGKSRLVQLRAVAKCLDIPVFTLFDADGNLCSAPAGATPDVEHKAASARGQHKPENDAIISLCGASCQSFPVDTHVSQNLIVWKDNIGATVRGSVGNTYKETENEVRSEEGLQESGLDKNAIFIGYVLDKLRSKGVVVTPLCVAVSSILGFAASVRCPPAASSSPPSQESVVVPIET